MQEKSNLYSPAAEMAIIGTIFEYSHLAVNVAAKIKPEHFFVLEYEIIIKTILEIITENGFPDMTSVHAKIKRKQASSDDPHLNAIHWPFINSFYEHKGRMEMISSHLADVREFWCMRQFDKILKKSATDMKRNLKLSAILAEHKSKLEELDEQTVEKGILTATQILDETMIEVNDMIDNKKISGISTGLSSLDAITYGYMPGELTVIGARPGMGKTAFALNMVANIAYKQGKTTAVFSLEMTSTELMKRMLSSTLRIETSKFRNGQFTEEDIYKLREEYTFLANDKLFFDDKAGTSLLEISSKCRQIQRKQGKLDLIVVDYLQLIQPALAIKKQINREAEVAAMSRGLRELAKDLKCPMILLAQLNRAAENRLDKRPRLADIRESGAVEQDADVVMFLYREDVYQKKDNKDWVDTNIGEVIVDKNRHGRTDTAKFSFEGDFSQFSETYQD